MKAFLLHQQAGETNLIGPLEFDKHMVRPITFQSLPPLSIRSLWVLDQMDT